MVIGLAVVKKTYREGLCSILILFFPPSSSCSKQNEGSDYNDNTPVGDKIDNAIEHGKTYKYTWEVPERAGPGTSGPKCATWAYYSDVNPIKDTNSGLVGPLVICKKVRPTIWVESLDKFQDYG